MRIRALAAGTLLPLFGLQCGDTLGPSACLDGVTFSVGPGIQPTFDWRPACRVLRLLVRPVEGPAPPVWSVGFPGGTNALEPPVRYGEVPAGADGGTLTDLVSGTAYRVTLYAWFRTDIATDVVALDSTDFMP